MVVIVHDNATYTLRELDRAIIRIPIAEKRVKAFKRRDGRFQIEDLEEFLPQYLDQEHEEEDSMSDSKKSQEDEEE